ncbi:hypothetical protein QAD02_001938 [Eretmocerus hayati]|uniref:Uncharacterized protein n=1 Tax=Eretmocerus hayati TaxID=131215 RepID=A0ACC2NHS7_9HYME|nr:hypothetical protein QAD02_001938 [Eretmocerus hayati]
MKPSNTTGLQRHLKTFHRKEYEVLFSSKQTSKKPSKVTECLRAKMSKEEFEQVIPDWTAYKNLPLNVFDDLFSQQLFTFLTSRIFPRRNAMCEGVMKTWSYEDLYIDPWKSDIVFSRHRFKNLLHS